MLVNNSYNCLLTWLFSDFRSQIASLHRKAGFIRFGREVRQMFRIEQISSNRSRKLQRARPQNIIHIKGSHYLKNRRITIFQTTKFPGSGDRTNECFMALGRMNVNELSSRGLAPAVYKRGLAEIPVTTRYHALSLTPPPHHDTTTLLDNWGCLIL